MRRFRTPEIRIIGLTMSVAFGLLLAGCSASAGGYCCTLSEPQPRIENTFQVSGAPELVVNNVNGPIHVIGDSRDEIRLSAAETAQGNSADDIARAKREVHLATKQEGNRVLACVTGPSGQSFDRGSNSGNDACERNGFGSTDRRYHVRFDLELHVPPATQVTLGTVNEGDIKVERVSGSFHLQNVNGGIELDAAGGAGEAKTVNGDVKATFAANPGANCSFSAVNGSVHTYFRPNLAAELRYKTLNGEVYSDFPVDFPVIMAGKIGERAAGSHRGQFTSGQVGSGGPEIELDTLNGNIFVHRMS